MYLMAIFSAGMFVAGAVLTYLAMRHQMNQTVELKLKAQAPQVKQVYNPAYSPVMPSRTVPVEYEEDDDE